MLEQSSMFDTPVRHDDLSITKTSLRSRMLISANNFRAAKKKLVKSSSLIEDKEKQMNKLSFSSEMNISVSLTENEDKENSMTHNETSMMKIDETCAEMTPKRNSSMLSCRTSDDVDMKEESVIRHQKHSTPRVLKLPARAVSSTPNQELFQITRLARHVSTQTTFTLNARDLDDFNEDLQSCCVEVPNKSSPLSNKNSLFRMKNNTSSPLRNPCTNNLISEKTPVLKMPSTIRKLSLRSKTMICSAIEKSKNSPNAMSSYKSVEGKRFFSNTFSILPRPKTPTSCSEKVLHNPFEVDLPERFGKSVFSPNVFDNVVSPSEDSEYLRWTIEDISSINPVPIEEDFTFPSDDEDPEKESQVQQEIDRYFSETHLVLSPFDVPKDCCFSGSKEDKFIVKATSSTPQKVEIKPLRELKTASTQTVLTLPEVLPDKLEVSLRAYFKLAEMDEFNISSSNLRRKLFFHSEDEPPSPVRFEALPSPVPRGPCMSTHSPYDGAFKNNRHFSPQACEQVLSSPVVPESFKFKNNPTSSCKKTLHHHFSGGRPHTGAMKEEVFVRLLDLVTGEDMSLDSSGAASAFPDTGYQTEESWCQSTRLLLNPPKIPFHVMASTPAQKKQ